MLTDPEIVKLQDIYDIVYFINPNGICTLLNTSDTHIIVNYVYQRFIKVKNWVPTRHFSYYVWLIYEWRELPHHFLCYNSGYYNDEMILSRWVPKFLSYDDFKNYDHYTFLINNIKITQAKSSSQDSFLPKNKNP